MIKVEYLVLNDNKSIKCQDIDSFKYLLQTDSNVRINSNKILFDNKLDIDFSIQDGKITGTSKVYFHLKFILQNDDDIEDFITLLRSIKGTLGVLTNTVQVLYDGVSLYYGEKAYPLIYEIENLLRKLITKFMLINVGAEWSNDKVPDDVKNSMHHNNKESTFLHNVDFIQLKNFLFSEKYTVNRDKLITQLKSTIDGTSLDLEAIKKLLPYSNWQRYFSDEISMSEQKLASKWDMLYDLRCKIAHNKIFLKSDYDKVKVLVTEIKPIFDDAIDKLDQINISTEEREEIEESVVGNFSNANGIFIALWRDLEEVIFETIDAKTNEDRLTENKGFFSYVKFLLAEKYIDNNIYGDIKRLGRVRNSIVHYDMTIEEYNLENEIENLKNIIKMLKGFL
ncbi:hypothetical protein HX069_16700 [Myroides odoratimimus]|uniref:HEPN domain-containing protein n=1 Tax=Myroides odoratimimus TaxID=76832 RepID=UPI0025762166|nr:HEPN domain-containing protein [Myroides odoratimimus]MDM1680768.1 hypothetical protein [Myroides odoratimimus]